MRRNELTWDRLGDAICPRDPPPYRAETLWKNPLTLERKRSTSCRGVVVSESQQGIATPTGESLAETFGLPLVEAMASGVPVIASDWRLAPGGGEGRFNVGPEVCEEAAEFLDPTNPASLANAIGRTLGSPERYNELVKLGLIRARAFSWEDSARQLLSIFEDAGRCRQAQG